MIVLESTNFMYKTNFVDFLDRHGAHSTSSEKSFAAISATVNVTLSTPGGTATIDGWRCSVRSLCGLLTHQELSFRSGPSSAQMPEALHCETTP